MLDFSDSSWQTEELVAPGETVLLILFRVDLPLVVLRLITSLLCCTSRLSFYNFSQQWGTQTCISTSTEARHVDTSVFTLFDSSIDRLRFGEYSFIFPVIFWQSLSLSATTLLPLWIVKTCINYFGSHLSYLKSVPTNSGIGSISE